LKLNYDLLSSFAFKIILRHYTLVEMAAAHPDKNFIGVEVHKPGIGAALLKIEQARVAAEGRSGAVGAGADGGVGAGAGAGAEEGRRWGRRAEAAAGDAASGGARVGGGAGGGGGSGGGAGGGGGGGVILHGQTVVGGRGGGGARAGGGARPWTGRVATGPIGSSMDEDDEGGGVGGAGGVGSGVDSRYRQTTAARGGDGDMGGASSGGGGGGGWTDNVRLVRMDALWLLRDFIPRGSLSDVCVYFPDPWWGAAASPWFHPG